ncbi:RT0821/Lpp0805 family surface protein [Aquamicrobium segne]|uniref:RT0821/Lpp0805 family surface protein n=1 Tax=Aquamicrobium segne TaxID=469547 RepID=A0ABW0GUQ4_9HYPH
MALLLSLGGCGMGGFSLEKAAIDRSIVTGNVSAAKEGQVEDVSLLADRITIRNAASAADLQELAGQPIPWVNADTGARGVISSIAEIRDRGELCRVFSTTRENFDGVALYKGRICMVGAGNWRIDEFGTL